MSGRNSAGNARVLAEKLIENRRLETAEYAELIKNRDEAAAAVLAGEAVRIRRSVYGDKVYIRGLIEISNICRNDCQKVIVTSGSTIGKQSGTNRAVMKLVINV